VRALALVVAALALAGAAGADTPTADVSMPGKLYAPSDLRALVGTTVTWRNGDHTSHTVTADGHAFDSGAIPPGGTFTRTFTQPGTYRVHCTIHRFMRGLVRVYGVVLTGPVDILPVGVRVTLSGLAPAEAPEVVLQRRARAGWEDLARRAPAPGGAYSFALRALGPAAYRTVAGGTASPVVSVRVAPLVAVRREGRRIVVTTSPPRPGARAVLQTYDREHFTFAPRTRMTLGARGMANLPLPDALPAYVRVVVRSSGGWSDGRSRVLLLRS